MSESIDSATRRRTPTPAPRPRSAQPGTTVLDPVALGLWPADPALDGPPPPGSPERESWLRRHRVSLPIVAALLLLTAWLIGTNIAHFPGFADDEGTYVAEAWAVTAKGALSHYTYWYDHPPLGWIGLALATWVLGPLLHSGSALGNARELMIIPALADAALLFMLARRFELRRSTAALAVLLFVASPLSITMVRQVYLDSLGLPWLLAAFVLARSPSTRLWACAGSGACLAIAVLTKETMLLFLPAVAFAMGQALDRRTRAFCLTAFAATFVLIGLGYPLYAALKGELIPGHGHVSLLTAVGFQLWGRPGTGSVLQAHSAARQLIGSWTGTDPWLLGLGLVATPVALFVPRLRAVGIAVATALLAVARGGYLPQPFVIGVLPLCALAAAGGIDAAWNWASGRRGRGAQGAAAGAVILPLLALAAVIIPAWGRADANAMSASQTRSELGAEHWIEAHVSRRARVLIDDTMYVDLVKAGFRPQFGVVWFYKMDFTTNLDPMIVRHLPRGWRAFDYVVSSPVIRSALAQQPGRAYAQVREALAHSHVVAAFGSGSSQIQIRRLSGPGVGSGLIPRATGRAR